MQLMFESCTPPSLPPCVAADAALNAFQQNIKTQPYVMKSLALPGGGSHQKSHEMVNRPFWWEVLCLVKPLSAEHLPSVMACFNNPQLKVGGTHFGQKLMESISAINFITTLVYMYIYVYTSYTLPPLPRRLRT